MARIGDATRCLSLVDRLYQQFVTRPVVEVIVILFVSTVHFSIALSAKPLDISK